jgi:hypothetical protein
MTGTDYPDPETLPEKDGRRLLDRDDQNRVPKFAPLLPLYSWLNSGDFLNYADRKRDVTSDVTDCNRGACVNAEDSKPATETGLPKTAEVNTVVRSPEPDNIADASACPME